MAAAPVAIVPASARDDEPAPKRQCRRPRPIYKVERIHKSDYIQRDRVWEGFAEWKYFFTRKQAADWVREHKQPGFKYRIFNEAKRDRRLRRVQISTRSAATD